MRRLGIVALAIGLLRLPLPQPDYHQIRHQHGAGEVCLYHDHLLRWHPEAGRDAAVAVLHWHWFVPAEQGGGPDAVGERGPAGSPRPALHAHADGLKSDWVGDLVVQADERGGFVGPGEPVVATQGSFSAPAFWLLPLPPPGLAAISTHLRAPTATSTPLVGLSQQANC
jgi:hypothetical protein